MTDSDCLSEKVMWK